MAKTYLEYRKLLQSLLPKGAFWTRAENSFLTMLLNGLGDELSRAEQRGEDLKLEAIPSKIQETFEEWELDFAIPDPGYELKSTDADRRGVIKAKFIATGQQNKEYYIEIGLTLGYTLTVEAMAKGLSTLSGAGGGSLATGAGSRFYWFVNIDVTPEMTEFFTKANISQLIYDISKRAAAHTMALFRFTGIGFDFGFGQGFDGMPWYDGSWWPIGFNSEFSKGFANNTDYDGVRLTGGFHNAFDLGFDSYRGGSFSHDEFDDGFLKPS